MEGPDTTTVAESSDSPLTSTSTTGPLVQVTFQKDPNRKNKYLESEPKALGCTQIVLGCFLINYGILEQSWEGLCVTHILNGIFTVIAGSMAIAAQNLKLPYVKSCLGVQVFTCVSCCVTFLMTTLNGEALHMYSCEPTSIGYDGCLMLRDAENHYATDAVVGLVTVIAISATLAAYCCKVVQCCSPAGHMPVITVHAPPGQE